MKITPEVLKKLEAIKLRKRLENVLLYGKDDLATRITIKLPPPPR